MATKLFLSTLSLLVLFHVSVLLVSAEGNSRYTRENTVIDVGTYFNTDGDECISLQEIRDVWNNALSPLARDIIQRIWREDPDVFMKNCDRDRDGRICLEDFLLSEATCLNSEDKIKLAYTYAIEPFENSLESDERNYYTRFVRVNVMKRLSVAKARLGISSV